MGARTRTSIATALGALALCLLALPSLAQADYEQMPEHFGVSGEAEQLREALGVAVNEDGAGGVPAGSLYVSGRNKRLLRFTAGKEGEEPRFEEAWGWAIAEGGPSEGYVRCGPAYAGIANPAEGTYEHCTKANPNAPFGGEEPGHFEALAGVAVDQATGNVYLRNSSFGGTKRKQRLIEVFTPTGTPIGEGFGDAGKESLTEPESIAEGPGKLHWMFPTEAGIAVDEAGTVYLTDADYVGAGLQSRVMSFAPCSPGDYEHYCYTGQAKDIVMPNAEALSRIALVGADRIVTAESESIREFAIGGSNTPLCNLTVKGTLKAMTANPETGEVFYYKNSNRSIYRLKACDEGTGKFEEAQVAVKPSPASKNILALAVNPTLQWSPLRPAGVLYAADGEAHEEAETESVQHGIGDVLAGAKGTPLTLSVAKTGQGTVTSTPTGIDCGTTCEAQFIEGSTVVLKAKAAAGWAFSGWSGECASTSGTECKVTMSAARSVTASFEEEGGGGPTFHTLKVHVTGEGSVSADSGTISACTSSGGPACEGSYEEGAEVTLTETPAPGSLFAGWGTPQCDESTEETCTITIGSADEDVAASFEAEPVPGIPLEVSLEGTGSGTVTSSPGLISCNPFCEDEYEEGTQVTLTASPSPGSLFMAWRHCDSVNGRQCTMTMSKAKEVSALFSTTHALTLTKAEGSGPGKVQSAPSGVLCLYSCRSATASFLEGKSVTLKATPAKHFHLASWGGDCSGTGSCELVMGEEHLVSASFEEDPHYPLTLAKSGAGQGIVKSHPSGVLCSYTCNGASVSFYAGEEVTLEVSKLGKGSAFKGWSGGGCSGTGTCTVMMSSAKEVTAELE